MNQAAIRFADKPSSNILIWTIDRNDLVDRYGPQLPLEDRYAEARRALVRDRIAAAGVTAPECLKAIRQHCLA